MHEASMHDAAGATAAVCVVACLQSCEVRKVHASHDMPWQCHDRLARCAASEPHGCALHACMHAFNTHTHKKSKHAHDLPQEASTCAAAPPASATCGTTYSLHSRSPPSRMVA